MAINKRWLSVVSRLEEGDGSEAGSSGEDDGATEGRGTGGDGRLGGLGHGAVAGLGGPAGRGLGRGGAGHADGLVDDSRNDRGDGGRDGLDGEGGAGGGSRRQALDGPRAGGLVAALGVRGPRAPVAGAVGGGLDDAAGAGGLDGADGGGDGDDLGLGDGVALVLGAVLDVVGALGDGVDRGAVDGRGRQGDDVALDDGRLGRAVGDGGAARGDGGVLGRVQGAAGLALEGSSGQTGTGDDSSEAHLDGWGDCGGGGGGG